MKKTSLLLMLLFAFISCFNQINAKSGKTKVSIKGEKFYINDKVTYEGKTWRGNSIEGLLPNCRLVNAIFDDETDSTRYRWVYPDTHKWDANRNTNEFLKMMPIWRKDGLMAFTINLQGGSPQGYSGKQPWCNTAIDPEGNLKPAYMKRLKKILDESDKLGMVTILGIYYFGQEKYINDEAAVKNGIKNVCLWIMKNGYNNVIIEIDNESDYYKKHNILKTSGVHEAIAYAKSVTYKGKRLLVSVSNGGGNMPTEKTVKEADFILLHGNGQHQPQKIVDMVKRVRAIKGYTPKPILFNEDDHFDFDKPMNNFIAATSAGASWGYFDYRKKGEPFEVGYQCVPVDWGSNTDRKKQYFSLLREWGK